MSDLREPGSLLARRGAGFRRAAMAVSLAAAGMVGAVPAAEARHHVFVASSSVVFEALVLDADTGQVLGENNADALTYPASLAKMMTLYLTFEALNSGKLRLDQPLPVSENASAKPKSHLGLDAGDSVPVRDLILAIVTKSANDAAAVLAEGLAGSESAFAERMTQKARQLGMNHTTYRNASGLPDPEQTTTARDIARLALALYQHFPREYRYFATKEFEFRGETVVGHDHLLDWYPGADGIKTGFINASGYNLATSAVQKGHRLIGVIMGGRTFRSRDRQMAAMLDKAFAEVEAGDASRRLVAAAPQAAPPSPPQPAAADEVQPAPARARVDAIGRLAAAAMRESSDNDDDEPARPVRDRWGIEIGAFREESGAQKALQHAARLHITRGKPQQILPPAKAGHGGVYRARLLHFTSREARAACIALHKKGVACEVVKPDTARYASG